MESLTLTRADIKALNIASSITFYDGRIIATKNADEDNPWNMTREMHVESRATFYDSSVNKMTYACHMIFAGCEHFKAILSTLKTGDKLSLDWGIGAATTLALESVGFVGDTLRLVVTRGETEHMFNVATIVRERDSMARMVSVEQSKEIANAA